jgi:mono/diheme cytochrome c family protein
MAGGSLFAARIIGLSFFAMAFALHAPAAMAQVEPQGPVIREEPGRLESAKPDIENGAQLAQTLCTSCHLIGETSDRPIHADVPSFAGVANRPNQTLDHLTTWLTEPHPPMPNLNLTRLEIRDLAGYIFSLRKE